MSEWDAVASNRLAEPQFAWGTRVLDRLALRSDETVMDAGCGTGRLTELLLERLPQGRVLAVDHSRNMLDAARTRLARFGDRIRFVHGDLESVGMHAAVDVVFSTATFHWVLDHDRLLRSLRRALRPGGWLIAQCGGRPNLARLRERVATLMRQEPFAAFFSGWREPWEFPDDATEARRLSRAGFVDIETSLEPGPAVLPHRERYIAFLRTVVLFPHLDQIPNDQLQERFLAPLVEQASHDDPPFTLDYWRLNLRGRRPSIGRLSTVDDGSR
jgi:trans-aconitate 2-methyltransferase